jgi:hypothetical protein
MKLGKRAAVDDPRIPRMSVATQGKLPFPPANVNWYAAVGEWGMLGNDTVGDCVEAAGLHAMLQMSTYAGDRSIPTTADALKWYEATGWRPDDPSTDQGSYVLGPEGMLPWWHLNDVPCGGRTTRLDAFMQIKQKNVTEWRQGIWIFGGLLLGIQLPEAIVSGIQIPYVWSEFGGPIAGGHEIWVPGYQQNGSSRLYDLISWGQRFRATEEFLLNCVDECVVIVDNREMNKRGVNAAGLSYTQLTNDLKLINRG